ncbi:MAG: hypothetical protein U0271_48105 [Polyangiaceae bacterium]
MIKSEKIEALFGQALEGDKPQLFFDAIERASGLPGPRPNLDLLRAIGDRLASAWSSGGEDLTAALFERDRQALTYCGLMALAARAEAGQRAALAELVEASDETHKEKRAAVTDALERGLSSEAGARHIDAFVTLAIEGGYPDDGRADTLTRRAVADKIRDAAPLTNLFEAALLASDDAPRSADRLQGLRLLREALPRAMARAVARFPRETLALVERALTSERPETRVALAELLGLLRKELREAEVDKLRATFEANEKPRRDAARKVQGTRKRSRGR